jgi:tetratricopeptide (TPR) repeat protein
LGTAVALVNPVFALLVAVGDLAASGLTELLAKWRQTGLEQLRQRPDQVLSDTIDAVTKSGPTVLALEDITGPGREPLWQTLLYHATRMRDRRVLVVVGADGPQSLEPSGSNDPLVGFAPLLGQVREAVRLKRASWWWVAPLDVPQVRQWVGPIDIGLAERLIAVSGGDDARAAGFWQQWVATGHVRKDTSGRWSRTTVDEPIEREIKDVLFARLSGTRTIPDGVDPKDLARQGLELAALSGPTFSAMAVSEVLGAQRRGVSAEEIADLLDELTPADSKQWLIYTGEPAPVSEGSDRSLHRIYHFATEDLAAFLSARWLGVHDGMSKQDMALELLTTVRRVHHDDPLFDSCCYQLARSAGRPLLAARYAHRMAAADRQKNLLVRAYILLAVDGDDMLAVDDVLRTAEDLLLVGQLTMAVRLGKRGHELTSSSVSQSPRARACNVYGRALDWSGHDQAAIPLLEEGVRLCRVPLERYPANAAYLRALAVGLGDLGVAYLAAGRGQAATDCLQETVQIIRGLLEGDPANDTYQGDLVVHVGRLGESHRDAGRDQAAADCFQEALRIRRGLLKRDPTNAAQRRELALQLTDLGSLRRAEVRDQEATDALNEAVLLLRGLLEEDPTNTGHQMDLAVSLRELGVAHRDAGRDQAATDSFQEAVQIDRGLLKRDPANTGYQEQLARSLKDLGVAHRDAGRDQAAIDALNGVVQLMRGLLKRDPANVAYQGHLASSLVDLGVAHQNAGRYQEGADAANEALRLLRGLGFNPTNDANQ